MLRNWPFFSSPLSWSSLSVCPAIQTQAIKTNRMLVLRSSSVNVAQNETSHSSQETQTTKHPPRDLAQILVWPEGVAALAIVLTLLFIAWQAMLMRQTILSSEDSSKGESLSRRSHWAAFFQDRQTNTVFEADPLLINTRRTPAQNKLHPSEQLLSRTRCPRMQICPRPETSASGKRSWGPAERHYAGSG